MKSNLCYQLQNSWQIISNAGSLFATRLITSGLGFFFWWLAARLYEPKALGLASAATSAMLLLGMLGVAGLDILLVGELPRRRTEAGVLLTSAGLAAGVLAGLLGLGFAHGAPYLSAELSPLSQDFSSALLFAFGVAMTSISLVADQAMIGLFRGDIQFWRNFIFTFTKLGVLGLLARWFTRGQGMMILISWVAGSLLSLVLTALVVTKTDILSFRWPDLRQFRALGRPALGHYALNLALQAPGFFLPTLVAVSLSLTETAYYYASWMIAGMALTIPMALALVLFAIGAGDDALLGEKIGFSVKASFLFGGLLTLAILYGAGFLLKFFGPDYAANAEWPLRILSLGVFPLTIKQHYVAKSRVQNHLFRTAMLMTAGAVLELMLAYIGGHYGGLTGLSLGWLTANCLEAIFMFPAVIRTAVAHPASQVFDSEATV